MPIDVSGFNVGETPYREPRATERLADNMQQNRLFNYHLQRQKEEDEWRKLNLIQGLTDLSQHQTASDVANAIGNQHAANILQKYTASAATMSPAELMGSVSKDMSGVINGMDSTKNELELADKQMAVIKQQFPDLDMSSMAKDYRTDILNRRLKNDSEFVNPIEVKPSQFDIGNPDFLSKYVTGDKNLRTYFQNPQGMDETSIYKGNPNSYTKYTAKIPPWKKTNFSPDQIQNGFLNSKQEPQLQFKSETLPSDALPASNGQPFEMMSKDAFDNVTGKEKLELIASTRKQVPNYDQMNATEKEYAQRHVLLKTAKAFDQTGFHPTEVHAPSAALLKFYQGDSGKGAGGELNYNNVFSKLYDKAKSAGEGYSAGGVNAITNAVNFEDLDQDEQKLVKDQITLSNSDIEGDNIKVILTPDDKIGIFKRDDGTRIGYVSKTANIKANTPLGQKVKQKAFDESQKQETKSKGKYDNL